MKDIQIPISKTIQRHPSTQTEKKRWGSKKHRARTTNYVMVKKGGQNMRVKMTTTTTLIKGKINNSINRRMTICMEKNKFKYTNREAL
jgi:hypothetical protein